MMVDPGGWRRASSKGGRCARWRWPTPPACPSCLTCPPLPNWAQGRGSLGPGGHCCPANTPADTVAALQKQVATAIQQPAIRQKLIDFGIEPVGSTPQQYAELIRTEVQRWHQLICEQKISLD